MTIEPRRIDLGGFMVRRSLPTRELRALGPWVFFDHFGPHEFDEGHGVDVIPHPHINLATVTYLFEGEIVHRDSIGSIQAIRPGEVNLMNAGRGIAHSERTDPAYRKSGHRVHGVQLWHALPEGKEEGEPVFFHHPASELPTTDVGGGAAVRVMIGSAFGVSSPVAAYSPILYCDCRLEAGADVELPSPGEVEELAVYLLDGRARLVCAGGRELPERKLVVLRGSAASGAAGTAGVDALRSDDGATVLLLGGSSLGKRYMWWNFVSSRRDRIEQARDDWTAGRFAPVPGDAERALIPDYDHHARLSD